MTDEEDRLVLASTGRSQRWVLHRPVDLYDDGYVHELRVEATDDGISVKGSTTLEGRGEERLGDFLLSLDRDWRGWPGVRSWTSMGGEMTLAASHDGTRQVLLTVTLRRPGRTHDADAWEARIALTIEAGEELRELAHAAVDFLRV